MRNDKLTERIQAIFEGTEDKNEAMATALELIATDQHATLIAEIQEEARKAAADAEYMKSLGLHTLTKAEEKFYTDLQRGAYRQGITADQIDIIPREIIDRTMDSIKLKSDVLSIIDFPPANVKTWVTASKSGTYYWGAIDATLTKANGLAATISSVNMELGKLWAHIVIPKAIGELALPFVDRYFSAILAETMQDGLEYGFLSGTGSTNYMPIGVLNTIASPTTAKSVLTNITSLTPVGLASACVTLSTSAAGAGQRRVDELHLICNPTDYFNYVRPAMMVQATNGSWVDGTGMNIKVHQTANIASGKAVLGLKGCYVMGIRNVQVKSYDQTLALDDADLVIAKAYANGRPVDDNAFVVFNPSYLESMTIPVKVAGGTIDLAEGATVDLAEGATVITTTASAGTS